MVWFETERSDITVIGGGLAGVCAAIAAARLGRKVALVNNRPVLGGNSSSEVRVWVCGATGHGMNRNAREGGVMGELFVENQYRNPEGNPYLWDTTILDAVRAEPLITTFLNTDVRDVEADGRHERRHIRSATGWMMGSERQIRFESPLFLDCTGDALIGHLAGADYRIGREARHEYNEDWAPEVADNVTLGSTLLFYTKDTDGPVDFIPPSFAKDISTTAIPEHRIIRTGDNGCAYWWIEWGGELDTVHGNDRIRDELWAAIYGIWDYIKNSGKFDAANLTLEWVGSLPGKREYRRLIGDYTLTENDILGQSNFHDTVAFGGWSIDLHPPGGMYAKETGSRHRYADGIYHIPFRSLYSANVDNLLMAGRDISASHVAFGSTRVMATCATLGEAAGTAAALCVEHDIEPRRLGAERTTELQQTLLRQDASVIGITNSDPRDLARTARVSATGHVHNASVETPSASWSLDSDAGISLPVDPQLDYLELLVDARRPTIMSIDLYDTGQPQNYVPTSHIRHASTEVPAGDKQWERVDLPWRPTGPTNAFVVVRANPDLSLYTTDTTLPGILCFRHEPRTSQADESAQRLRDWNNRPLQRQSFCFRAAPESTAWAPQKATDGLSRPYGGPHMWVSEPLAEDSETWLALRWDTPQRIRRIELTLDDDPDEDLINLHHHRTPFRTLPTLLRDYRVEISNGQHWTTVADVRDNRVRRIVHALPETHVAEAVRVVCESTNGTASAHVVAIRVY